MGLLGLGEYVCDCGLVSDEPFLDSFGDHSDLCDECQAEADEDEAHVRSERWAGTL